MGSNGIYNPKILKKYCRAGANGLCLSPVCPARGPPPVLGGSKGGAAPRPPLPLGSFPGETRQGVHRLFQPLQMQQVFRAVAEALG